MLLRCVRLATLCVLLLASACKHALSRSVVNVETQQAQSNISGLGPKEGLSFRYHDVADGANTNGSTPITDYTNYEVSDGTIISVEDYSFKRQEDAVKFFGNELTGAQKVLERTPQTGDVTHQRAVIEVVTKNRKLNAAAVELSGSSVREIIGYSAGHVLAFEQWRKGKGSDLQ